MQLEVDALIKAQTSEADATLDRWRAEQDAKGVTLRAQLDKSSTGRASSDFGKLADDLKSAGTLNLRVGGIVGAAGVLAEIASIGEAAAEAARSVALLAPAGGFAGLASIGSIAAGIHGVPAAFKAISSASADSTESVTKQRDALDAVSNAEYSAAQANQKLGDAYKEASRSIRDMNDQLQDQKFAVQDAALNVDEAAKALQKVQFDPTADADTRKRALLQYQEAVQHSKEAGEKLADQAQDTAAANAKGVSGSDAVVQAIHAQTVAQQELTKAQATAAAGTGGGSKVADALAKLSPNAKELVADIRGLGPAWHDAQQAGQDALTSGLGPAFTHMAAVQLPNLKAGIVGIDTAVNSGLKGTLAALTTDSAKLDLHTAFDNTSLSIANASKAAAPLTDSMLKLISVGSTELPGLGLGIDQAASKFDAFIQRGAVDGSLKAKIDDGVTSLKEFGQVAEHVGSSIGSIFRAAGDGGQTLESLDNVTKHMADFLKSPRGQTDLSTFFANARGDLQKLEPVLEDLPALLKAVYGGFSTWSDIALPFLQAAASLLKDHPELVQDAAAAYVAFKSVKPIIDGVTGAVDLLAKRAGAVGEGATGLNKWKAAGGELLGLLGSPWTAGLIAAGSVVLDFSASANRGADAVQRFRTQALQAVADNNSLYKALESSHGITDTGVLDREAAGIKNFRDGLVQNAADVPGFRDKVYGGVAELGNSLFGIGGGVANNTALRDSVGRDSQAVKSAFDQLGLSNDQLADKITGHKADFDAMITRLNGMGDGGKEAASKLQGMRDEWALDVTSVQPVTDAIKELGDKNKDAATQIDAATQALERQRQGNLTVEAAQEKMNAALTTLGTSAQSAGGAVIDASGKIDTTSQAGQNLYNLINQNLAPSWENLTNAVIDHGRRSGETADQVQQDAQKSSDASKSSAEQQIMQMGYTQTQADTLLQHYGLLDKDFHATATLDTSQADTSVDALTKKIQGLLDTEQSVPGFVQLFAAGQGLPDKYHPDVPSPTGPIPSGPVTPDKLGQLLTGHSDGGPIWGPGTDTSDSIVTRLSTGEYVIKADAVRKYGMGLFDGLNSESIDPAALSLSPQLPASIGQLGPSAAPQSAPQIGTAPPSVINPQAPAPAPMTDDQLTTLQDRAAVDQANTERNAVYANPSSTAQDKQAADYKYLQSQNTLQSATKKGLPEKYTLPGIASSAAGILAQGFLSSLGLGQSILSDQGTYATDINTAGQWLNQQNPQLSGTYTYTPRNLPSVVTPDLSTLSTTTGSIGQDKTGQATSIWNASGGAEQWRGLAAQILAKEGFAPTDANVNTMLAQVNTESGGNPTAVNLWDSNAQAGHPSQGLLQTIPSTFATWRDPSLPNDINDPAANMAAALRYYRANYGNDLSTEWGHGHGYDDGGIASGIGLMLKQTLKPERVLSPKQTETFDSALPLLESINNSAWSPNRIDSSSLSPAAAPQSAGAGRTFAPTINARVASVSDLADLVERQAQKDAIGLMAAMP
ncbi:transglycosylase SLT domain-containing protein [Nocardia albiluteola]|nr:transglycosylase SLT domain-containing protein [Nocardia albiluteola]